MQNFMIAVTCKVSVLEAEVVGAREALSWFNDFSLSNVTTSMVSGLQNPIYNLLKVGDILKSCRGELRTCLNLSIIFSGKQTNRAAQSLAKMSCEPNCYVEFVSPVCCIL